MSIMRALAKCMPRPSLRGQEAINNNSPQLCETCFNTCQVLHIGNKMENRGMPLLDQLSKVETGFAPFYAVC